MKWTLPGLVVGLLTFGGAWADDCGPPAAGEKLTPPWECCKADTSKTLPEDLLKTIEMCHEKYKLPGKMSDEPKGPPSNGLKLSMVCSSECVFKESGLLTADKTINKDAVIKIFTKVLGSDSDWGSAIPKILDKCLSSSSAEVDKSLVCKSGAKELEECIMREAFLACPKKLWSDASGCATLKAKVTKCPKMTVMFLKPIA